MESIMDIFNNNAFSTTSLTQAISEVDYVPQTLGELGIFEPEPIRTRTFAVEKKAESLALIPTSPLGAPPAQTERDGRNLRDFRTVRLADGFTLYAYELENIRKFGEASVLQQVQEEYMMRMMKVRRKFDLTREHMRLGALQGKLLDADGTTVIYDYFAEFGITEPAAVDMELDDATTNLRIKCHDIVRDIGRSSKGALPPNYQLHALCGDDFYDLFVTHPKVERQFENWSAASELGTNSAWKAFEFGDIIWHNYRGTDDNSTIAVPTGECKFFPVGGNEVFKEVLSPAEFNPWINTLGQPEYVFNIVDKDRGAWSKGEMYSYPLYFCAKPNVLRKAIAF